MKKFVFLFSQLLDLVPLLVCGNHTFKADNFYCNIKPVTATKIRSLLCTAALTIWIIFKFKIVIPLQQDSKSVIT